MDGVVQRIRDKDLDMFLKLDLNHLTLFWFCSQSNWCNASLSRLKRARYYCRVVAWTPQKRVLS